MQDYDFHLLRREDRQDGQHLAQRPMALSAISPAQQAAAFVPDPPLENAIQAAIALGAPLLLTGEAGLGKSQVAYYVAQQLGLEPVLHFYTQSRSQLQDLLYEFDANRYAQALQHTTQEPPKKSLFVQPRLLWQAFRSDTARVLLIDNIDAAPRDLAYDLIPVLAEHSFFIKELNKKISVASAQRPLIFFTSNQEKPLPAAFLRRCVHHALNYCDTTAWQILNTHRAAYPQLDDALLKTALTTFTRLRTLDLYKKPSIAEFLDWLQVLSWARGTYPEPLPENLAQLPYLGVLLKEAEDTQTATKNL